MTPLPPLQSPHIDAISRVFAGDVRCSGARLDVAALLVCFTNRSGSNLLCDLLASTGAFPLGREFFNGDEIEVAAPLLDVRSFDAYVRRVCASAAKNGRVVLKVGAAQLACLHEWGYLKAFRQLDFVVCSRRDRVAQAVSFDIAEQTGAWTAFIPGQRTPVFDADAIRAKLEFFDDSAQYFYEFFRASGHPAHVLEYEDVQRDRERALTGLSRHLRVPLPTRPEAQRLQRQNDGLARLWRRRFLAETPVKDAEPRFTVLPGRLSLEAGQFLISTVAAARGSSARAFGVPDARALAATCDALGAVTPDPSPIVIDCDASIDESAWLAADLRQLYGRDIARRVDRDRNTGAVTKASVVLLTADAWQSPLSPQIRAALDALADDGLLVLILVGPSSIVYDDVLVRAAAPADLQLVAAFEETYFFRRTPGQ